jgi:hypothetical protein
VTEVRAKVFLSVRGRYDYTAATIGGILQRAGEPVDLCIFDDRSKGEDADQLWDLYESLRRKGKLAFLAVNTERTTGGYPWGKAVMLAQFAKLLELECFRGGADVVAVVDNDVELKTNWLTWTRRALELAEKKWPGRAALASPIHEANHPVEEEVELAPGLSVYVKRHTGSAVWVFRPDFFSRYGLPDLKYGGHGGEDLFYEERIAEKGHLLVALKQPLAFHAGVNDSARKLYQGERGT